MIDKIAIALVYFAVAIVGLAMLPYLLYLGWVRIRSLNKRARGLDLGSSAPSSMR